MLCLEMQAIVRNHCVMRKSNEEEMLVMRKPVLVFEERSSHLSRGKSAGELVDGFGSGFRHHFCSVRCPLHWIGLQVAIRGCQSEWQLPVGSIRCSFVVVVVVAIVVVV